MKVEQKFRASVIIGKHNLSFRNMAAVPVIRCCQKLFELPVVRLDKSIRYRATDVEQFIRERMEQPKAKPKSRSRRRTESSI